MGVDNWRMAVNRLTAIALASTPPWVSSVYFWLRGNFTGMLLSLGAASCVPASMVLLDWASAKVVKAAPERSGVLYIIAAVMTVLYASLLGGGLWQAEAKHPPVGSLWETTNRLAIAVREDPAYNLHTVEEHIMLTFLSPRAAYELYAIGEQQGIFPFRKRSYEGLRRWGALDNLLTALVEHARIAAKRGDWQRCRTALQLALRTMEKAAELQVPNDLKPRLDTRMVPVQSFALIHIRGGFEHIYPLLKEIASWSPAHRHQMEHALQQGRRVGNVLVEVGRKSRPLLGVQRQPAQRRQLEVIFDESLRKLSLQLLGWEYSIEDGLQRIWAMEQQKHTR